MKELYINMTSGISGDMTLALLLSLGADKEKLLSILSSILGQKVELELETVWRQAVACNKLNIKCNIEGEPFRHFSDIKKMIESADCKESIKANAIKSFEIIAEAESKVHGIDIEEVHFHEIGAVDTIIDLFGVSFALDDLGIEKITANKVPLGTGFINAAHGLIMLPAPATLKILHNIPVNKLDIEGEFVTPTGAAILKTYVSEFTSSYNGIIINDSYATGEKEFAGVANMLQGIILENGYSNEVINISTNIDNMTGEQLGYLYEKLMEKGALDVAFIPAFMKKNRPAYVVNIMTQEQNKENIIYTLFKYSSTIGMRVEKMERVVMNRKIVEKEVLGEKIRVKEISYKDITRFSPEYEDIKRIAKIKNISIDEVLKDFRA